MTALRNAVNGQVEYFQLEVSSEQIVFEDDMAVCSHPALGDDYLEKLQAVGLNSVPSWMKAEKALSTGQQQRIRSAIRASSESKGILYDDFCCFVDQQNLGGNDFQHVFEDFVWTFGDPLVPFLRCSPFVSCLCVFSTMESNQLFSSRPEGPLEGGMAKSRETSMLKIWSLKATASCGSSWIIWYFVEPVFATSPSPIPILAY